jgi:hypothetical protein
MQVFWQNDALKLQWKWNLEALTDKIVHWYLDKIHDLGASEQNNTMVGQHKLSLLDRMFLDFF